MGDRQGCLRSSDREKERVRGPLLNRFFINVPLGGEQNRRANLIMRRPSNFILWQATYGCTNHPMRDIRLHRIRNKHTDGLSSTTYHHHHHHHVCEGRGIERRCFEAPLQKKSINHQILEKQKGLIDCCRCDRSFSPLT